MAPEQFPLAPRATEEDPRCTADHSQRYGRGAAWAGGRGHCALNLFGAGRRLTRTYARPYALPMKLAATRLRAELYRVIDHVLETGETVEVERPRGTVVLKPAEPKPRAKSRRRAGKNPRLVVGDPDDLVQFDWSKHWKPFV